MSARATTEAVQDGRPNHAYTVEVVTRYTVFARDFNEAAVLADLAANNTAFPSNITRPKVLSSKVAAVKAD